MAWSSSGILTAPASDTILADSGPLLGGMGEAQVLFGGNTAVIAVAEHRNAANTANVAFQVVASPANTSVQHTFPGLTFAANERFRLRLNAPSTGSVQGSVFTF